MFLAALALCWVGKTAVLPVFKLLGRGKELENPHYHTAFAFALVAAVFAAIATGLGFLYESALDAPGGSLLSHIATRDPSFAARE